jgi:MarR family transcriptional regulator, transcriptional regulator for hemolysin
MAEQLTHTAGKSGTALASTQTPKRNSVIQIGFLVHDVSRLRHSVFDLHVRPEVSVTRPQWRALVNLTRHDGEGTMQVELARLLGVGKVALGKMIDRMEKSGLVSRVPDLEDRRSKRIRLTRKGQAVIERMERIALRLSAGIMKDIPEDKQEELREMLVVMKRNLIALERSASRPGKSGTSRPQRRR